MDWDGIISLLGLQPNDVQAVATAIIACGAAAMVIVQAIKAAISRVLHVTLSAAWAQGIAFVVALALAAPTLADCRASPMLIVLGVALAAITGPLWHDLLSKLKPATSTAIT